MRLALALAAVVVAACSGPVPTPPDVQRGIGDQASFLLANPAGLVGLDASCKVLGRIVALPDQSAPATPALHPSKRSVAFALTKLPDAKTGFGSDIYTVGLDGTGLRALVEHERENVFYASPRYDPSGDSLYVHRRAALIVDGQYRGNEDSILRVDLKTGAKATVLIDASDPDLSPDGRTLVYVKVANGTIEGLWVAGADGTGSRPFLRTRDIFWYMQAPRFAPSGKEIVFSAAGHQTSRAQGQGTLQAKRGAGGGRLAHLGVPSELFIAPADGSAVRSIGQTGDDVVPAWSPDGTRLAYVGTGAFFTMTVAQQDARVCAQGQDFFFGDLLWLR